MAKRVNDKNEKTGLACLVERLAPQNQLSIMKQDNLVFLEDDDEVVMDAWFINRDGERQGGFGTCRGTIKSANLEI
jgi:fumarylacetoacetase